MEQTNYSNGNKSLFYAFIIMVIAFVICSCGSRKVEKNKTDIVENTTTQSTKVDSSKTLTKSDTNTKIVDSSSLDEFTISPQDSTKEMVVNGKTYFNSVLKHKNVKTNKVFGKKEIVETVAQNDVKEVNSNQTSKQTKIEAKVVDRKQYDWTKTIIVISIILGLACWLIWFFYIRKPKKTIEEIT